MLNKMSERALNFLRFLGNTFSVFRSRGETFKGLAVTTNGSPQSRAGVGIVRKVVFNRAKELIF